MASKKPAFVTYGPITVGPFEEDATGFNVVPKADKPKSSDKHPKPKRNPNDNGKRKKKRPDAD
jgi:hypothetical protein